MWKQLARILVLNEYIHSYASVTRICDTLQGVTILLLQADARAALRHLIYIYIAAAAAVQITCPLPAAATTSCLLLISVAKPRFQDSTYAHRQCAQCKTV